MSIAPSDFEAFAARVGTEDSARQGLPPQPRQEGTSRLDEAKKKRNTSANTFFVISGGEPMRLAIDPIVLAPEAVLIERAAPCEPCARCGLYYRLVRVGRLWMQPQHECRVSQEEAVN